jgi:hypothetical protein
MNQFFEGLANQNNAEVTSVVTKDNSSLRAGGYLTINKGLVSINISYWADVYESQYPGYVSIDNLDYSISDTTIGGVKVDSLSKFNEGLGNMGLTSIVENLKISDDDIRNEIDKSILASNSFKGVHKGLKLFESLTYEEKKKVILDFSIENYDKANPYSLNKFGLCESPTVKPSLEELKELAKPKKK